MTICVQIPTALRRFTSGAPAVDCHGSTLADVLDDLGRQHPDLNRHLRDEGGELRAFVNVYVNEEDIRYLGGPGYQFQEGDEVMLVPSIAGGAPAGS